MKTLINFLIWITCMFSVFAYSITANARDDSTFSPRQYCNQTNGIVTETGNPDIYLCCYEQQKQCIISNTASMQSRRLNMDTLWANSKNTRLPVWPGN